MERTQKMTDLLAALFAKENLSKQAFDTEFDNIVPANLRKQAAMFCTIIDFKSHVIGANKSSESDDHYSELDIDFFQYLILNYRLWKRFR